MLWGMICSRRRSADLIIMPVLSLLTLLNCFSGNTATAATISISQSRNDLTQIFMSGEFVPQDLDRFVAASANARTAVVRFNSRGGHLQTGLLIGLIIRQRGFTTALGPGSLCYSSCALAWLAGRTRLNDVSSKVGFHAAADANHSYSAEGTEMMRAYARSLGLSTLAAKFLTDATPDAMRFLTADSAKELGVNVIWVGNGRRL
jgi:hypothetical protein